MTYSKEYQRRHNQGIRKARKQWGKASDWQCVLCFDVAREWAHLWRTHDPEDPEGFVPMCRQDHYGYDYEQHVVSIRKANQSPEKRSRLSAWMRKQNADPEFRARLSEAASAYHKARWRNPEYRARMSAQSKANWANPECRARMLAGLRKEL